MFLSPTSKSVYQLKAARKRCILLLNQLHGQKPNCNATREKLSIYFHGRTFLRRYKIFLVALPSFLFSSFLCLPFLKAFSFDDDTLYSYLTVLIFCDILYCDTIDEIVIGLTLCAVQSLITTVNTVEKYANLPVRIMKTTLLLSTPTPTQQDISKMVV